MIKPQADARLETVGSMPVIQPKPISYCSNTQNHVRQDNTRLPRNPQLGMKTEIVNLTRSTVLVTDHANVVYVVPPCSETPCADKVIIRRQVMMYSDMASSQSVQHSANMVARQGFETAEYRQLRTHYNPNFTIQDVMTEVKSYVLTYEIPIDTLHAHRSIHHLQSDLVFTVEHEPYSHPNSENTRRQAASHTVFTQPGISGMTVEIVDNHNEYTPRYICMGGQAIEIRPHRDAAREHGVHITTMRVTADGDVHPHVEVVSMEVARERYGLFSTREEAISWGRTDLSLAVELDELRARLRTDEIQFARERAELQRRNDELEAAHKERLRAMEIEHLRERRGIEIQSAQEDTQIRVKSKTKEVKLDHKKKKNDLKHDKKSRKVKDHFETRAAVRSDTSSFFKSIPGMITGVVALVAVGASLGKWISSSSDFTGVIGIAGATAGITAMTSVAGAGLLHAAGKVVGGIAGVARSVVGSIASVASRLF